MANNKEKQYCDLLTPIVCDGCDEENDVAHYCLQCNANICSECKITHCNTKLHRNHIILPRNHPEVVKTRRSKKIYCPNHTGKEYVTFCTRCKQACCAKCITGEHDGHKFCDLEYMISQTESQVDVLVQEMETNLIPQSEDVISQFEEHIAVYKNSVTEVKQCAKAKKSQHIEEISKRYEDFIEEVNTRESRDLGIMKRKKREIEEHLGKIKSVTTKGKTAAVDASILLVKDELEEVRATQPSHITFPGILSFRQSSYELPALHGIIGTISSDSEKEVPISAISEQHKVLHTINGISHASAIAGNCGNWMWIYNQNESRVIIYDEYFNMTKDIYVEYNCSSMAMYGENEIIFTNPSDWQVLFMSSSGSVNELFYTEDECSCLCVNNNHEIVVTVKARESYGLRRIVSGLELIVYSSDDFHIIQEINLDPMIYGENITQLKQTVSGEYVVATYKQIICTYTDFDIKWTNDFESPFDYTVVGGLYCDKYNNILVGDMYKEEIVMFNLDGQRVRTLLTKDNGIRCPLSISEDNQGRLWIGQEDNILITTYLS